MKKLIFVLFALASTLGFAQVTVAPVINPHYQLFNAGVPCSGCLLDTFSAGTTTPLATYSESTGTTLNANPVVADSNGFVTLYLTSASYKLRLRTAAGVTLWTQDGVSWANLANTVTSLISNGTVQVIPATAATAGANQTGPNLQDCGNYWNGSASAADCWTLSDVLGTGSNPTSTFTLTHSGSSGAVIFSVVPNTAFSGNVSIKGPVPFSDATQNGITAGVDGSASLQTLLTACALKGGETFFPVNASGTHYLFASAVNENSGAGCALDGHSGPTGPILEFTGATANLQLLSTNGLDIHDITIENSNAGFTSNIVDMAHNGGGNDSSGNFINRALITGFGTSNANCGLSLDKTIFTTVANSTFANAVNLLCLAASNLTYSNGNRILNNIFSSSTGSCSGAMILNPKQGTAVIGNGFELGVGAGNCAPLGFTASASAAGLLWTGNWHGDSNSTVDRTLLNWNVGGGELAGNFFSGNQTHDTLVTILAGSSIAAHGNSFQNAKVIFDVTAGSAFVDIAGNDCRAGGITTQLNGTPAAGRYQDCSIGDTTYYGKHIWTGSNNIFKGNTLTLNNSADAENDVDIIAGSASDQNVAIRYKDKSSTVQWTTRKTSTNTFELLDSASVQRIQASTAGGTIISSGNAASVVTINGTTNSGTGGMNVASGGASPATVASITGVGLIQGTTFGSKTNCSSSGGTCSAAPDGSVSIAAAATTVTVATTAVTANSQILLTRDNSLGTKLSVTCNTQSSLVLGTPYVSARTAATSFVITIDVAPTTNPLCISYSIVN